MQKKIISLFAAGLIVLGIALAAGLIYGHHLRLTPILFEGQTKATTFPWSAPPMAMGVLKEADLLPGNHSAGPFLFLSDDDPFEIEFAIPDGGATRYRFAIALVTDKGDIGWYGYGTSLQPVASDPSGTSKVTAKIKHLYTEGDFEVRARILDMSGNAPAGPVRVRVTRREKPEMSAISQTLNDPWFYACLGLILAGLVLLFAPLPIRRKSVQEYEDR